MIELKYSNYDELPIEVYLKIRKVVKDDDADNLNRDFELIALLCDMSVDDLLKHNVEDLQGIINKCRFLTTETINIKKKIKSITLNGIKYNVITDLKDFTVAQYVDFQNYPKNEENLAQILSTFVIPKGKKYGEYDVVSVINDFNKYMSISDAISIENFFFKKSVDCTKTTLHSSLGLMKHLVKKSKKTEEREILINQIEELQQKYGYLL